MKYAISLILLTLTLAGCGGGTSGTGTGDIVDPPPTLFSVSGQANKGPFAESADVSVSKVLSDGSLTDQDSAAADEEGGYTVRVEENSVNLITVSGNYFSEHSGEITTEEMSIAGVFAGGSSESANVNVLTHLIHERVLALITDGDAADNAIDTAQTELMLALADLLPTPVDNVRFSDLVVINAFQEEPTEEGNSYLLAVTSVFEQYAIHQAETNASTVSGELATILDSLADGLASDGALDLTDLLPELQSAQRRLNPNTIHQNLFEFDERFKELIVNASGSDNLVEELDCTVERQNVRCFDLASAAPDADQEVLLDVSLASVVADMNAFIDSDGDGLVNTEDNDDDGDGIEDEADSRPFEAAVLVPPASSERFVDYMKSGLRRWSGVDDAGLQRVSRTPFDAQVGVPEVQVLDSLDAIASPVQSDASDDFTTTNVLVAGVDEIDQAKYDGQMLYLANGTRLQAVRTHDANTPADVVGHLDLTDEDSGNYLRGLYLSEDAESIVAVSGQYFSWYVDWFAPWNWREETRLDLVDVSEPAEMNLMERMVIDGTYINSRRIGDKLYLITRFTPPIADELVRPADTEEEQETNEETIESLDIDDLLPKINYSDGSSINLVNSENCFLPPTTDEALVEYPTLTTISAIDLADPRQVASVCMTDGVQGLHLSLDAIYLAALDSGRLGFGFYSNTVIHKFSIADELPRYVGSGTVEGTFWGDPTFLMGEHEGNLTVVTTRNVEDERQFEHLLTVIGESDEEHRLVPLGRIPDKDNEQVIGKPGEQIFASRIFGDRAYIVTFQQVDPVYVIDLADPTAPEILGELEIPGFSTYLHPVSDELLLGVGRDTTTVDGIPFFEGINLRLFDVSDPSELSVLSEISIGKRGTETPVSWDPHAFTLLSEGGVHRLSVPVRVHGAHVEADEHQSPWQYYPWTHEALYLFEIDTSESSLTQTGLVVGNDFDTGYRFAPNCCNWSERSFLNGDAVHYLRNNTLMTAPWNSPEQTSEAFLPTVFPLPEPTACTEELRNGLNLSVVDRVNGEWLRCAVVEATDGEFKTTLWSGCPDGEEPEITGLYERPGSYRVTVSNPGYETWVGEEVVIQADQCHVHPTYLGVFLEPLREE